MVSRVEGGHVATQAHRPEPIAPAIRVAIRRGAPVALTPWVDGCARASLRLARPRAAQDDYEALLTLYPVCGGVPPTPRCDKADRNIGLLRMAVFVMGPLLIALVISIFLHVFVEREEKKMIKKKEARLETRKASGKNLLVGIDAQRAAGSSKVMPAKPA